MGKRLSAGTVLPLLLAMAGCSASQDLARRIAEPPRFEMASAAEFHDVLGTRAGRLDTDAEPSIAWWTLEPGDYAPRFEFERNTDQLRGQTRSAFNFGFRRRDADAPMVTPRGTAVLLHGWSLAADSMLPWALDLAAHDLRVVAIDLRNHGASGRAPAGFGTREADDVAAVLAELDRRGELVRPVVLMGLSYGAVTAIETLGRRPHDIDAAVALAPFSNAGQAAREMLAGLRADRPASLRSRAAHWRYGRVDPDGLVDALSQRLQLDLETLGPGPALAAAGSCVVLLHGAHDTLLPVEHSRALVAQAPRARLVVLPDENHRSLPLRMDWLGAPVATWLLAAAERSDGAPCPEFNPPPDPAARPEPGAHAPWPD